MDTKDKLELNKKIRKYEGSNNFLLSLQKQLKNSKYLDKIEVGNRKFKVLSDKQYESIKNFFEDDNNG